MNRHQSNPFLHAWDDEPNCSYDPKDTSIFDTSSDGMTALDDSQQVSSNNNNTIIGRRHSSSNSDLNSSRLPDRRLFQRNMSSFEAASLHQQMQENASKPSESDICLSSQLIAKMTAEFKSAIESKEKEFALTDEPIEGFNVFDPFETIVDDDISYPSPSASVGANNNNSNSNEQQHDKSFDVAEKSIKVQNTLEDSSIDNEASAICYDERKELRLDLTHIDTKLRHDSIDDDDDDLISTPVRIIKSSMATTLTTSKEDDKKDSSISQVNDGIIENIQTSDDQVKKSYSHEKAHLMASLLDSAEKQSYAIPGLETNSNSIENYEVVTNLDDDDIDEQLRTLDASAECARVIRGSPTPQDGNPERPVSFFDPFETVIDRDALTSLMNDSNDSKQAANLGSDLSRDRDLDRVDSGSSTSQNTMADQKSIDTVIESTNFSYATNTAPESSTSNQQLKVDNNHKQTSSEGLSNANSMYCSLPRPKPSRPLGDSSVPVTPIRMVPRSTPIKKAKQRKTTSSNAHSDDSSDTSEDEHLKIVIRARDPNQVVAEKSANGDNEPVIVPLLPPPPSKSDVIQTWEQNALQDQDEEDEIDVNSALNRLMSKHQEQSQITNELNEGGNLDSKGAHPEESEHNDRDDDGDEDNEDDEDKDKDGGQFIIRMTHSDEEELEQFDHSDQSALYDTDTTYELEEFITIPDPDIGWKLLLRYPPKKKFTSNRFWKEIGVKLVEIPIAPDGKSQQSSIKAVASKTTPTSSVLLQIFNRLDDNKPMQEIPLQPTYTVSEISSQQLDQFGKLFTVKLQYVFYKERVGVRQGQIARFMHSSHIGTSTTSGGHGIDPISVGAIKRLGAPVEHSAQISQIVKLGSTDYNDIKQFKNALEDRLFRLPIWRDRPMATYKTEEIQMLVRDETYIEVNHIGHITRQVARVRLFFLSFLNGNPSIEVGINDITREGKEVVGRMDILPVVTEEWIRLEACELHSTVDQDEFNNPESRLIKFVPPDATYVELMRFRVRPPRNRQLPLQISANMSVTRTRVVINVDCMVPGSVDRKMGPIPCENIAIRVSIPDCWIYQFREEKHFRMGSKKSVKNAPGRIKGMSRFLTGAGSGQPATPVLNPGNTGNQPESCGVIEVTSGQAKYEHHHRAIVWRAYKWPKDNQQAYVQNSMKIYLTLTAYDQMPDSFYEFVHVEYFMPATTVSHTSLRSISVNPCDDEPPEKFVKYLAKYEYKVKMRLSINLAVGSKSDSSNQQTPNPITPLVGLRPELNKPDGIEREADSNTDSDMEDEGDD